MLKRLKLVEMHAGPEDDDNQSSYDNTSLSDDYSSAGESEASDFTSGMDDNE